jgi:hypothetical protein
MKRLFPILIPVFLLSIAGTPSVSRAQPTAGAPSPKTTEVMVTITARQGVTRQQIMNIMPAEIRATVQLYLDGRIRQWYSRSDGKGVILFIDTKSVDEARTLIDALPLSKANLMDDDYIPVGPLMHMSALISDGRAAQ